MSTPSRERHVNWDKVFTQYVQGIVSIDRSGETIREFPTAVECAQLHGVTYPSIKSRKQRDRKNGKDWDKAREQFRARLDEELLIPENIRSQVRERIDLRTARLVEQKLDILEKGLTDENTILEAVSDAPGTRERVDLLLKATRIQQQTASALKVLHETGKSALEERVVVNADGTAASDDKPLEMSEIENRIREMQERERDRLADITQSVITRREQQSIDLTNRHKRHRR